MGDGSLRHNIFEIDDIVENVAGTTFERMAPTIDRLLSTESLTILKNKKVMSKFRETETTGKN